MSYNKLIVVGNGFDLAHGLKTSYWDFAEYYNKRNEILEFKNLESEVKLDPTSQIPEDDNSWYSFEDWIALISSYCFGIEFNNHNDSNEVTRAIAKMNGCNDLFHKIAGLMMEYLHIEQTNHPVTKINTIEEEFKSTDSITVSFNYTDTIKRYTNDYDYIHGNINDDQFIVFGLANNILPDLVNPPYIRFDKEVLKFELLYVRFLRNKGYNNVDSYLEELDPHLKILFSGKGGWNFPIINSNVDNFSYDYSNASEPIKEFSELYPTSFVPYYQKFAGIKELVIMGHGLKSDTLFFHLLNDQITSSLEKITFYKYTGEKQEEIEEKIKLLRFYFGEKPIVIKSYE